MKEQQEALAAELEARICPVQKDKPYVFVSYASQDCIAVYQTVLALQAQGVNVWLDTIFRSEAGYNWQKSAFKALHSNNCLAVLFFISEYSIRSPHVLAELAFSANDSLHKPPRDLRFIPISLVEGMGSFTAWSVAQQKALGSTPLTDADRDIIRYAYKMTKYKGSLLEQPDFDIVFEEAWFVISEIERLCFGQTPDAVLRVEHKNIPHLLKNIPLEVILAPPEEPTAEAEDPAIEVEEPTIEVEEAAVEEAAEVTQEALDLPSIDLLMDLLSREQATAGDNSSKKQIIISELLAREQSAIELQAAIDAFDVDDPESVATFEAWLQAHAPEKPTIEIEEPTIEIDEPTIKVDDMPTDTDIDISSFDSVMEAISRKQAKRDTAPRPLRQKEITLEVPRRRAAPIEPLQWQRREEEPPSPFDPLELDTLFAADTTPRLRVATPRRRSSAARWAGNQLLAVNSDACRYILLLVFSALAGSSFFTTYDATNGSLGYADIVCITLLVGLGVFFVVRAEEKRYQLDFVLLFSVLSLTAIGAGMQSVFRAGGWADVGDIFTPTLIPMSQALVLSAVLIALYAKNKESIISACSDEAVTDGELVTAGILAACILLMIFFGTTINGRVAYLVLAGLYFPMIPIIQVLALVHCCILLADRDRSDFEKCRDVIVRSIFVFIYFIASNNMPTALFSMLFVIGLLFFEFTFAVFSKAALAMVGGAMAVFVGLYYWGLESVNIAIERIAFFFMPNAFITYASYDALLLQPTMIENSLAASTFWGTSYRSTLPAGDTALIFTNIVLSYGWLMGIVVILLFFVFAWRGILIAQCNEDHPFVSTLCTAFTLFISIQAAVYLLESCGLAPVMGGLTPFLSNQTVYTTIWYTMVGFLLYHSSPRRCVTLEPMLDEILADDESFERYLNDVLA